MALIKGDRFEYVNVKYGVRHRVGLHGTVDSGPYPDEHGPYYSVYFDNNSNLQHVYEYNMRLIDRENQIDVDVSAYL